MAKWQADKVGNMVASISSSCTKWNWDKAVFADPSKINFWKLAAISR